MKNRERYPLQSINKPEDIQRVVFSYMLIAYLLDKESPGSHFVRDKNDRMEQTDISGIHEYYLIGKNSLKKQWRDISLFNTNYDNFHLGIPLTKEPDFLRDYMNQAAPKLRAGLHEFLFDEYALPSYLFDIELALDPKGRQIIEAYATRSETDHRFTLYVFLFYVLCPFRPGGNRQNISDRVNALLDLADKEPADALHHSASTKRAQDFRSHLQAHCGLSRGQKLIRIGSDEQSSQHLRVEWLDEQTIHSSRMDLFELQTKAVNAWVLREPALPIALDPLLRKGSTLHPRWKFHGVLKELIEKESIILTSEYASHRYFPYRDESSKRVESESSRDYMIFVDLRGFRDFFAPENTKHSHRYQKHFLHHACKVLERNGGWIIETAGDGVFANLTDPTAHQEILARFIKEILEIPWRIRCGIAVTEGSTIYEGLTGPLHLKKHNVSGARVNVAARLESKMRDMLKDNDIPAEARSAVLLYDPRIKGLGRQIGYPNRLVSVTGIPEVPTQSLKAWLIYSIMDPHPAKGD